MVGNEESKQQAAQKAGGLERRTFDVGKRVRNCQEDFLPLLKVAREWVPNAHRLLSVESRLDRQIALPSAFLRAIAPLTVVATPIAMLAVADVPVAPRLGTASYTLLPLPTP